MNFIDTHQHLIWRDRLSYGWTKGIPALAEADFSPEDYQDQTRDQGILGTVFMETGVDDADYQNEARYAATRVGAHGILGQIASCRPEEAHGFEAWLDECADLKVNGFRRILHVMPDALSQEETFQANLRKIGKRGLPFDLCFLARQLPVAVELARACPDQSLVLDHCGGPDIAGARFEAWAAAMDDLSQFPHVHVKLSGITTSCAPGTASLETLRPWVDHILHRFGPKRMVWGSDWPVVVLGSGLRDWIDLTRHLLSDLNADEQAAIGTVNARTLYRL